MSEGLLQMPVGPNGGVAYGLVRSKEGKPRVDNLNEMPKQIWDKLSDEDREYLLQLHGSYTPIYA
jgi:hypothetical protein